MMKHTVHLVLCAAGAYSLAACILFKPPPPPSTQGANPLVSGAPLVASTIPNSYPGYQCKPRREPLEYKLTATAAEICIDFHGGAMMPESPGNYIDPPPLAPLSLRIDGKTTPEFPLQSKGSPTRYNECFGQSGPVYRDWQIDARGCTPNNGQLTAQSQTLTVLGGGAAYADFHFGTGTVAAAQ